MAGKCGISTYSSRCMYIDVMYFLGHHHVSSTNSNLCTLSYNNDLSANRINTGGLFQILYCLLRCPGRLLSWNSGITLVPCYFVLFRGECTVQYMKTQSSSVFFKDSQQLHKSSQKFSSTCHHPLTLYLFLSTSSFMY